MAVLTAAEIATRLSKDNRTVVVSKDPANAGKFIVATDVGPVGATYGLANAKTATAAAYTANATAAAAKIVVTHGNGGLSKNDLRTQYFFTGTYDSTKVGFGAKRCFVSSTGMPLDANGVPTTVALAIDAETTDLTALGQAVTNYAQVNRGVNRTPAPGAYSVDEKATSLYAPYVGWTAQH